MRRLLVTICVAALLVGCGNPNNNAVNNEEDMPNMNVDVNNETVTVTTDETETKVSLQDSLPLPEGFPIEILDVYPGSFISAASHNEDGSYLVMAMTNEEYDTVVEFYKAQLEGAVETMVSNVDGVYVNMGNLNGYAYTVSISESVEELGYKHAYTLMVMPELTMDEPAEDESDAETEGDQTKPDVTLTDDIPENYPSDQLPLYMDAPFEVRVAMEQAGQQVLAIASEEDFDITVEYYQALLQDASDYSTMAMNNATMVQGTIDDILFMLIITKNDGTLGEPEKFQSLVQIIYEY